MSTEHKRGGFTLIELMITLAVAAILLAVGVPSFQDYIKNQRVKTASQTLLTSLIYVRSEAVKRNADVTITATDGSDWASGWTVSTSGATNLRIQPALEGVTISANGPLTYTGNGRIFNATSITFSVCDKDASDSVSKRDIKIELSGRPNLVHNGQC